MASISKNQKGKVRIAKLVLPVCSNRTAHPRWLRHNINNIIEYVRPVRSMMIIKRDGQCPMQWIDTLAKQYNLDRLS